MTNELRTCKLCDHPKKLIKSHIIPEFLYKGIYQDAKFTLVEERDGLLFDSTRRKGVYDNSILCAECDQRLNQDYDDYASKVWNGYQNLQLDIKDYYDLNDSRVQWRESKKIEAERFKMFFMSVLWRASISRETFFDNVSLGRTHESAIKNLILKRGIASDYNVLLGHYTYQDHDARKFISSINRFKRGTNTYYSALFSGIQVFWFVTPGFIPDGLGDFVICERNYLRILKSPTQGFDMIRHFLGEKAINMPHEKKWKRSL